MIDRTNFFKASRCIAIALVVCNIATLNALQSQASEPKNESDGASIAGDVGNINHEVTKMGFRFKVLFKDIQYSGEIRDIKVVGRTADEFRVRVNLQRFELTINNTVIRSSRHHASCGPMQLQLGTQHDIEVEYVVKRGENNELELVDSQCKLDQNNWTIGRPEWIKARGFGLTQTRVATELSNGLNNNVPVVERQLLAKLPTVYDEISQSVDAAIANSNFGEPSTSVASR